MHPDEALLLVRIFEDAIAAIWRAHGADMADSLAAAGVETPRPEGAVWCGRPDADDADF